MSEIKVIVVGVDGSKSSRAALSWAYDEATHHGASLTVISTWHPPALPMTPPYGSIPPEGYVSQPKRDALDLLQKLVADLEERNPPVDVRTAIEEGNPSEVLIEQSKEADLIVVGSRGHGGFAGMLLGSVSQHLATHAGCPVVIIR
jgi:nucleotide-binding universal stress UspA family protein